MSADDAGVENDERQALDLLTGIETDLRRLMLQEVHLQRDLRDATRDQERHERARLLLLIEVVDAFERVFVAIEARPDDVTPLMRKWLSNFKTIRRMVEGMLRREGVVPVEVLGEEFDPEWHRILRTVVDPEKPDGTIVAITGTGYLWKGQLLRETEVVVVGPSVVESGEGQS